MKRERLEKKRVGAEIRGSLAKREGRNLLAHDRQYEVDHSQKRNGLAPRAREDLRMHFFGHEKGRESAKRKAS